MRLRGATGVPEVTLPTPMEAHDEVVWQPRAIDLQSSNLAALMEAVVRSKPSGAKGQYIKSAVVKTTMGPGVPLDVKTASEMTTA